MSDLLIHLDAALDALAIEAWRSEAGESGTWERVPRIQATIAEELDRVDRALGPKGQSMFAALADRIRAAVVEIEAARNIATGLNAD